MTNTMRIGRKIGAVMGAIVFAIFGLVPGFYFGSFGTMVVLSHLMGGPVEPNILTRMMVVVGIALGIFCVGAVSIVLGSVFGTAVAYLTEIISKPAKEATPSEVTTK